MNDIESPRVESQPAVAPPDILHGTIAEMTWMEVEEAAAAGAVLLWAFGVIEQHGPHLPTGTDVYIPSARLRKVQRLLGERGIRALIVPAYYWGVNQVSGGFPASYRVRPETMQSLMADVFDSLRTDGFRHVFCFTGHGDALHNQTIYAAVSAGVRQTGLDISYVTEPGMATRLGLDAADPLLTMHDLTAGPQGRFFQVDLRVQSPGADASDNAPRYVDVHAGRRESSVMLWAYPSLVRDDTRRTLESTDYVAADLTEWRKGFDHARRKTPLGYLGDPAGASAEQGQQVLDGLAERDADAIERRLRRLGAIADAA